MTYRYEEGTVALDATVRDAMLALERSGAEVVLVLGADERLVGITTDGDLRRGLLAGASLDGPVAALMRRDFTAVAPETGRAAVLDLMHARRFSQVPIVDRDGKLCGLHLLHDVVGRKERENCAVIMAGGRGTRLAPLTDDVPKPMLQVAGRPILERIVLGLVGAGIRRIFLAIHYLGHRVEEHFGDGRKLGCDICYLREREPLGTAGALSLLDPAPSLPLLVMNGDLVTQLNAADMLDFHGSGGQRLTVGTRRYLHRVPFGCVELRDGAVASIEEKPLLGRVVNAGIYVVDPELVARVPKGLPSTMPGLVQDCLDRGELVRPFAIEDEWIDVGQHEQLRLARGEGV